MSQGLAPGWVVLCQVSSTYFWTNQQGRIFLWQWMTYCLFCFFEWLDATDSSQSIKCTIVTRSFTAWEGRSGHEICNWGGPCWKPHVYSGLYANSPRLCITTYYPHRSSTSSAMRAWLTTWIVSIPTPTSRSFDHAEFLYTIVFLTL